MPLEIMEDPDWKCPHCLGICFAGACKREGKMQPYEPKGTLLGHDTKKVADVRSVEALVDFSVSNLNWIKDDEALPRSQSKRLSRAKADAEKAKEDSADIEDDDDDAEHDHLLDESRVDYEHTPATGTPIDPALTGNGDVDVDSDAYFARRLQQANISVPPPAAMLAGAPVGNALAPDGYAPASMAGYMPPPAHMYGHIDENGDTNYPDPYRPGSVEPMNEFEDPASFNEFGKRQRTTDEGEQEDIAMTKGKKPKKPRLSAAGFKSVDLADTASTPPKNEVQRQFGKEKERKALEKAKADGRFIMVQAALKGKKRIVKLSIPGRRLGQLLAAKAAQAAQMAQAALASGLAGDTGVSTNGGSNGQNKVPESTNQTDAAGPLTTDLLTSDIAPKKDNKEAYQKRVEHGHVITSRTKKALIPVEKDENYGHRSIAKKKTNATEKRPGRKANSHHVDYEEVDIGSDLEEEELFVPDTNKRRSVPNYLKDRYNDDSDLPDSLPDDFRDRQWDSKKKAKGRKSGATASAIATTHDVDADAGPNLNGARPPAGKRPSMRPAAAASPHPNDDANSTGSADEDANIASTQSSGRATPVSASANAASQPPASSGWTAANRPQASTPSAAVQKQRQRQSAMDEENRKAKLQALQMMEDASPGASATPASAKGKSVRFSTNGGAGNNISIAEGLDDESSDDEIESVPAKRGRPVETK